MNQFTEKLPNGITLEMVSLPAGKFLMVFSVFDYEKPQHQVQVNSFAIGKYPITQEQYQEVMGNNPSHFKNNPQNPVENVSWDDAEDFCQKLSQLTGKTYRLPTEAEWEYACRAGTTTDYYFGDNDNQLGDYAWYDGNSNNTTHPVGQKKPNAWGLYDMSGNVWEWCEDSCLRGGSWGYFPDFCRSAIRRPGNRRDHRYGNFGFRVVCVDLDREGADSPRFWDKADRLMMVTVGGAALGGSIAGVYGAVIGAILAAGCGWYITFRKAK
jgi:formylglycine-generating enzyme required for sulfatase activity